MKRERGSRGKEDAEYAEKSIVFFREFGVLIQRLPPLILLLLLFTHSGFGQSHPIDRLDLNSATVEQLKQLPGIGPVLAGRIIEHRRKHGSFRRPQDIIIVRGMSAGRFRRIAHLIRTS